MKKLYFSLLTLLLCFVANAQIVNIPDNNLRAKLLSASVSNNIASVQIILIHFFHRMIFMEKFILIILS